jgi:hypothetical protein
MEDNVSLNQSRVSLSSQAESEMMENNPFLKKKSTHEAVDAKKKGITDQV